MHYRVTRIVLLFALVLAVMVIAPSEASAAWGISGLFYSGDSGLLAGYSATFRNIDLDIGWYQCYWEEWDEDYGVWYCADEAFYDFPAVVVDSWLGNPSGDWFYIGRGLDYFIGGYGYELYPGAQYGQWMAVGDHFILRDNFGRYCWGSQEYQCSGWFLWSTFWFYLGSTSQGREVEEPYVHCYGCAAGTCGGIERGNEHTAYLRNSGGLTEITWSFTSNSGTITGQNANNVEWSGIMVASGTIRVSYNGGFKECTVTVNNRLWSVPLPPLDHADGSPANHRGLGNLPQPPTAISHLGEFAFDYDSGPNMTAGLGSQVTVETGPNKDFAYFTIVPSSWNAYWINPQLDYTNPQQHTGKPNTEFASKQCGNFNGTNGFMRWQDLVEQTRRHEFDHETKSHRGKLNTLLAQGATNPGVFLENKVWGPGTITSKNQFNSMLADDFLALVNAMKTIVGVHDFPGVNQLPSGEVLGFVNLPPYTTAPVC